MKLSKKTANGKLAQTGDPPHSIRHASVDLRRITRRGGQYAVQIAAYIQPGGAREDVEIVVTDKAIFSAREFAAILLNEHGLFDDDLHLLSARDWTDDVTAAIRGDK